MLKVGIDVDGVLALFERQYENLIIQLTGKNLFPEPDPRGAPVWDWPQYFGYTDEEVAKAWKVISERPGFWTGHQPMAGAVELAEKWHALYFDADVYFVTARPGPSAKTETEFWLESNGIHRPTVLISSAKGDVARALKLDAYIDDKFENSLDVAQKSPNTANYLLNRTYNEQELVVNGDQQILRPRETPAGIIRVPSVREFLARVDANL